MSDQVPAHRGSFALRWWTYQSERFPIFAHGLLIAAFSFSAVCFSALLRGQTSLPAWPSTAAAFGTAFLFFLQLRIADEFKDFEEDSRYRPYRPVPRGLVSLRELAVLFALAAAAQLALCLWLEPRLFLLLAITWTYLVLMSNEFFVAEWLKRRHLLYLFSHMAIVPLVDFYATACDWQPAAGKPPDGLLWFVLVSYFNGIVIELGRKIRVPGDEETGVNTYSALWGTRTALLAWLTALLATAALALVAAGQIDFVVPAAVTLGILLLIAASLARMIVRAPATGNGKKVELLSGVWTLSLYLVLGAVPLVVRSVRG